MSRSRRSSTRDAASIAPVFWLSALQQLERLQQSSLAEGHPDEAGLRFFDEQMDRIMALPPLQRATAKQLIVDLQAPRRVFAAYAAADPTLGPEVWTTRVTPAATALYRLLRGVVVPFAATDDAQPSSLGLSTGQQLEQSGFLQTPPQILEATAQQLDTDCEQQRLSPTGTAYTAGAASHTGQSNRADSGTDLSALHAFPLALLLLTRHAAKFWPAEVHDSRIVPLLYQPVLRLANATFRHLSACLEQLPADGKGPPSSAAVLLGVTFASADMACWVLDGAAQPVHPPSGSGSSSSSSSSCARRPVVLAPDFLPCLCLLLTLESFAILLLEECSTTDASTSRVGSSSSTSRSRQQQQQPQSADYPWQLANSQYSCLPLAHDELMRQLGVGSKTALWAAATLACAGVVEGKSVTPQLLYSTWAYHTAVNCRVDVTTGPEQQHQQQQQQHGQEHSVSDLLENRQCVEQLTQLYCPATQALHFLTASVLLHCAAHYPPSSEHYPFVCSSAAIGCRSAVAGWKTERVLYVTARDARSELDLWLAQTQASTSEGQLTETQASASEGQQVRQPKRLNMQQQQEQQQEQPGRDREQGHQGQGAAALSAADPVLSPIQHFSMLWAPLLPQLLDEHLALVIKVLTNLLLLHATEQHSCSTASNSSSSSSGAGPDIAGASAAAGQSLPVSRKDRQRLCVSHDALSAHLTDISDDNFFDICTSSQACTSDSLGQALSSVWQKHSAQLCTVLEHCLRLQAAVPAFSQAMYYKCIASMCCNPLRDPQRASNPHIGGVLLRAWEQMLGEQQQQLLPSLLFTLLKFARLQAAAMT